MTESEERAKVLFEGLSIKDRSFNEVWASMDSEELQLFWVANSSRYERLFLAENAELALYVAKSNGDLRDVHNGQSRLVSQEYLNKHPAFASAIAKAIKAGKPGAVHRLKDDCACVGPVHAGSVTYTPLHVV